MSAFDELLALCRDMHAAGETPTYAMLRARRGGGSKRDFARALRAWRVQNPEALPAVRGRPSRIEVELRGIIADQQMTIHDQTETIRILRAEVESLSHMVRKYRAYPEDFEEPS